MGPRSDVFRIFLRGFQPVLPGSMRAFKECLSGLPAIFEARFGAVGCRVHQFSRSLRMPIFEARTKPKDPKPQARVYRFISALRLRL